MEKTKCFADARISFDSKEFEKPFKLPKLVSDDDCSLTSPSKSMYLCTVSNSKGLLFYARGHKLYVLKY